VSKGPGLPDRRLTLGELERRLAQTGKEVQSRFFVLSDSAMRKQSLQSYTINKPEEINLTLTQSQIANLLETDSPDDIRGAHAFVLADAVHSGNVPHGTYQEVIIDGFNGTTGMMMFSFLNPRDGKHHRFAYGLPLTGFTQADMRAAGKLYKP